MHRQPQSTSQGRTAVPQGTIPLNDQMRQCIKECLDCHATCLQTVTYCLQQGAEHAAPDHIRLLLDCVEICRTSADFMLRGSPLHARTCGICAELCELCAQDCDAMGDDATMKACAEACRRCAASCRRMSGQGASA